MHRAKYIVFWAFTSYTSKNSTIFYMYLSVCYVFVIVFRAQKRVFNSWNIQAIVRYQMWVLGSELEVFERLVKYS